MFVLQAEDGKRDLVRSSGLGDVYKRQVREQNLRVAGYPRIEPKAGGDASRLEFSAIFEVYPELKLNGVGDKTIERPRIEVGETEVDLSLIHISEPTRPY